MPGGFVASYFGNIDDSPIQVGAGTGAVIGALTVGTYFAIVNNRDKTSIEGSIASISEVVGRIREIGADSFYHFRVKTAQKETKAKREARLIDLSAAAYEIAQGASTPPSP
jgi:hypothetical protein